MQNYDTSGVQQKRRKIKIKGQDGCDAGEPCQRPKKTFRKAKIEAGQVFGRLTAISKSPNYTNGDYSWLFRCDCGTEKYIVIHGVIYGHVKSCSCLSREVTVKTLTTHGMIRTAEYRAWCHLRERCLNPNDISYHNYGGRGIKVCERWKDSFQNFIDDIGRKPSPKHSIDRINNDGDHCPDNCRWATRKEQINNRRVSRFVEFAGERLTVSQWSEKTGFGYGTILFRLRLGWSAEDALTKPTPKMKRKQIDPTVKLN